MENVTVKFSPGNIYVDGVQGYFSQTNNGSWCHIHHVILESDVHSGPGYHGCAKRDFVGNVSKGVYGDPSQGIKPCGNEHFGEQVEEKIAHYIKSGRAQFDRFKK